MKQACEVCRSKDGLSRYQFGGQRPARHYAADSMTLCGKCREAIESIMEQRKVVFRQDERDTTNSRQSLIKSAIKRSRFGRGNIFTSEIKEADKQQKMF